MIINCKTVKTKIIKIPIQKGFILEEVDHIRHAELQPMHNTSNSEQHKKMYY